MMSWTKELYFNDHKCGLTASVMQFSLSKHISESCLHCQSISHSRTPNNRAERERIRKDITEVIRDVHWELRASNRCEES